MNLRAGIASFLCKKAMHDTAAFQKASQSFAAAAAKAIIIIFAGGVYVGKNSAHGAECINFACKIYARSAVQAFSNENPAKRFSFESVSKILF